VNVINWTKKARKQLVPMPRHDVDRIITAVESLLHWPNAPGIRALANRDGYRLRVGRYRILFSVTPSGAVTVILIEEVKKRDEHTY
jgi:mRNA-degrading endonuclease RelE of RelBE toxin-antitoxin system